MALAAVVFIGAVLRLTYAANGGLWRDEAHTIDVVSLPGLRDVVAFLVDHEAHPPLFYTLLRWWRLITPAGDFPWLVPSLIAGVAVMLATWWFARSARSPATGLIAALFVSLSPSGIEADGMVRPYALLRLLLLLAAFFLWRATETYRPRALTGWAALCVAALYLHNWALLPVLGMMVVAWWLRYRGPSEIPRGHLLLACSVVALAWLPWIPSLLVQLQHGGHLSPPEGPLERLAFLVFFRLPGLDRVGNAALLATCAAVLLLEHLGSQNQLRRPSPLLRLLGGTVVVALTVATIGSWQSNLLVPHVAVMISPLIIVALTVYLSNPPANARKVSAIGILLCSGLAANAALRTAREPRSSVALMANVASGLVQPGDLLLVMPPPLISSFSRYYRGSGSVEVYPGGAVSLPFPFDDHSYRQMDSTRMKEAEDQVRSVFIRGGRVWQVATDVPPFQRSGSLALERMMTALVGPPQQFAGERTRAAIEEVTLRVWTPRASARTAEDPFRR